MASQHRREAGCAGTGAPRLACNDDIRVQLYNSSVGGSERLLNLRYRLCARFGEEGDDGDLYNSNNNTACQRPERSVC